MADVVAVMRAGRIEQSGPPSGVYQRPVSEWVGRFLGDAVAVNPSGGALRSNPIMATGLCRIGYVADHIFGGGSRGLAHSTSGPCLQQNLICILEGRS